MPINKFAIAIVIKYLKPDSFLVYMCSASAATVSLIERRNEIYQITKIILKAFMAFM